MIYLMNGLEVENAILIVVGKKTFPNILIVDLGNPDLYELNVIYIFTLSSSVAFDILWDIYMLHMLCCLSIYSCLEGLV